MEENSQSVNEIREAVLVGLNKYKCGHKPLEGCVNDVDEFEKILLKFKFKTKPLKNEEATRSKVIECFEDASARLGHTDVFCFYFSGHGTEVLNKKKHNGYNEAFCCYDGNIKDDELKKMLRKFKTRNVSLIFDSCHSGDITRDRHFSSTFELANPRGVPPSDDDLENILEVRVLYQC